MPKVELAVRSGNLTSGTALIEIIAGASVPLRITEITVTAVAALSTTRLGLGIPAAAGVTPTKVTLLNADPLITYTPVSAFATAWGTAPTAPSQMLRQVQPRQIGDGVVWAWPWPPTGFANEDPLVIPAGQTLVLWNQATGKSIEVCVSGYEG